MTPHFSVRSYSLQSDNEQYLRSDIATLLRRPGQPITMAVSNRNWGL